VWLAVWLARRLLHLAFAAWGVLTLTFVVSRILPADPVALLAGPHASVEVASGIAASLGLDQPPLVQYTRYLVAAVQGDLGTSFRTGQPVSADLRSRFPATLELVLAATGLGLATAFPLGIWTAVRHRAWPDYLGRAFTLVGMAVPSFWLGLILIYLLFFQLRWLPAPVGRLPLDQMPPPTVSGLLLLDTWLAGRPAAFGAAFGQLILPAITLAFVVVGPVARVLRASLLEVLSADYIRTARAMGLAERTVLARHALRNALLPTVTVVGTLFGNLLGGAVLVETVFAWPGLGRYAVESIQVSDYAALQGFVLLAAGSYVLVFQAVDALYVMLDPRTRPGDGRA
jgi:ABC-type dipeptide/oligopeptide/nickel transport system permease component